MGQSGVPRFYPETIHSNCIEGLTQRRKEGGPRDAAQLGHGLAGCVDEVCVGVVNDDDDASLRGMA
jgi:hypothetical protein